MRFRNLLAVGADLTMAEGSRMRLSGMKESIGPISLLEARAGVPPPVSRPRCPAKERDGRSTSCSSYAMSSGRLFLDRVARQHCPSPLHRLLTMLRQWGKLDNKDSPNGNCVFFPVSQEWGSPHRRLRILVLYFLI